MFQRSEKSNVKVDHNCKNQTDDKARLFFKSTCRLSQYKIYAAIYCKNSIAVIQTAALPAQQGSWKGIYC